MRLSRGDRLGPYEIVAPIGAGGMGEVYRARDMLLKREVALKVLPEGFAQDPDRLARFQREAEFLATLNHPNIAAVYGLEHGDAVTGIVLELVDGETLADLISRGPLTLAEALPIARQIAEALDAAHERGVIHRDLKPANIKVTPDGKVKVLDFGLAKALEDRSASLSGERPDRRRGFSPTHSPTLSVHATGAGVILGTAAYMSPEQARGTPVDRRTDIWAFGCVLFEMLTGRQAFETGDTVSDAIAAILKNDPDWSTLPAGVPDEIRLLLRRCLEKDRTARIGEIGTARFLMTETIGARDAVLPARPASRRSQLMLVVGLVAGASAATATAMWMARRGHSPAPQPMRFALDSSAAPPVAPTTSDRQVAFSHDGTHVAYVAAPPEGGGFGQNQLMVRRLDQLDVVAIAGATNPREPFFSPDDKWIGYFDGGTQLMKIAIAGGPPIALCPVGTVPRGASWGSDDTIVFASGGPLVSLRSVPAGGGTPKELATPDAARGEAAYILPWMLPGGAAVLYTIRPVSGFMDNAQVAALDLRTGQSKILIRGGSSAEYIDVGVEARASGGAGFLVYASAGSLRAVRFDPTTLDVLSDPVPVLDRLMIAIDGGAQFAVSRTGALVYMSGGITDPGGLGGRSSVRRTLVWVDRRGREAPIPAPERAWVSVRLSPDATRIALDSRDQDQDIWIFDLARQTLTRLTTDPAIDGFPIWTPDGRRILFESNRVGGIFNIFAQPADGTGAAEPLTKSATPLWPFSISPDGTRLVLHQTAPQTGSDLAVLMLDGKSSPQPLVHSAFTDDTGEISPDGRWLAYTSTESGQPQVFVRPFPDVDSGRWQVSAADGSHPVWARNSRELFYLTRRAVMAVPIGATGGFSAGTPTKLFEGPYFGSLPARVFDVSPDGQKFLMIKDPQLAEGPRGPGILVVLNWIEELNARVPGRR